MAKQKAELPEDTKEELDEGQWWETIACEKLDEILSENTLAAVADGTITQKLLPYMLDEEDWDLIGITMFISFDARKSNIPEVMLHELIRSLYCIVQYFRFCHKKITDSWAVDMHCFSLSDELVELPDQEYGICVAQTARTMGFSSEEIFALLEYLCVGDSSTVQ